MFKRGLMGTSVKAAGLAINSMAQAFLVNLKERKNRDTILKVLEYQKKSSLRNTSE